MIGVLIYCGLWLLTFKFGAYALAQSYAAGYPEDRVELQDTDSATLQVFPNPKKGYNFVYPYSYRGFVKAPMPFLLIWQWEEQEGLMGRVGEHSDIIPWKPIVGEGTAYYVWFPGRQYSVSERSPKFNKVNHCPGNHLF